MTTKIVKCNDNFGPFLSKDGKNVDLFNREMVKDLDLFYRGFLRKGGAVAPFALPLATPLKACLYVLVGQSLSDKGE